LPRFCKLLSGSDSQDAFTIKFKEHIKAIKGKKDKFPCCSAHFGRF